MPLTPLPTQKQLLLPLLETLSDLGGSVRCDTAIRAVSDRLGVPTAIVDDFQVVNFDRWGTRKRSAWRQTVHWVRMNAVTRGLIERSSDGFWTITAAGEDILHNCKPGLILVVYETPNGEAVWAEAITAAASLQENSVQLVFSSPPYPILNGRKYGKVSEAEVIELTMKCARHWHNALTQSGSLVLNFKDTWKPKSETGGAVRSLYQERILLRLCDEISYYFADRGYWHNPSHLPESCWTTVKKVRLNSAVEQLFWLSKGPNPFADVNAVLKDAAPATIEAYIRKSRRGVKSPVVGPSGQNNFFEEQAAAAVAGKPVKVIPRTLHEYSNADTHSKLRAALAAAGLPRHDAMMPLDLAKFYIRFLTRPGDLVADNFLGSGTTAKAAEDLNRRWVGSDRSLSHVVGSSYRMPVVRFDPDGLPA